MDAGKDSSNQRSLGSLRDLKKPGGFFKGSFNLSGKEVTGSLSLNSLSCMSLAIDYFFLGRYLKLCDLTSK